MQTVSEHNGECCADISPGVTLQAFVTFAAGGTNTDAKITSSTMTATTGDVVQRPILLTIPQRERDVDGMGEEGRSGKSDQFTGMSG